MNELEKTFKSQEPIERMKKVVEVAEKIYSTKLSDMKVSQSLFSLT